MARILRPLFFLSLILSSFLISITSQPQPCTTHKFPNKKTFAACNDLPVLNSTLHWNFYPSTGTVDVAFRQTVVGESRWIAWAINPTSTGMVGSQAIVAFRRTDGSMSVYASPIRSDVTLLEQGNLSFPVHDVSATYENSQITIFATIGLPNNVSIVNHVWQEGLLSRNTPTMHSLSGPNVKSFGTLDFISGQIKASRPGTKSKLQYAHGIINTISWGILMPVGIIIARYVKEFRVADPLWFYLHISCQFISFLVGFVGWGTGIYLGRLKFSRILYKPHGCIGCTLLCLAIIQVLVGSLFRPKKDHKNRFIWELFHYAFGYATIILGIINIFKGFDILEPEKMWKLGYILIIGVLGCIAAGLEAIKIYNWFFGWKMRDVEKKTRQEIRATKMGDDVTAPPEIYV